MRYQRAWIVLLAAGTFVAAAGAGTAVPQPAQAKQDSAASVTTGVREAAWSPDGKRLAVTWFDAIWTMTPEGKDPRRVAKPDGWIAERDPAWSPDGKSIAFSAITDRPVRPLDRAGGRWRDTAADDVAG